MGLHRVLGRCVRNRNGNRLAKQHNNDTAAIEQGECRMKRNARFINRGPNSIGVVNRKQQLRFYQGLPEKIDRGMDRSSRVGGTGTPSLPMAGGGGFWLAELFCSVGREMMESILVDLTNANIQSLEMA